MTRGARRGVVTALALCAGTLGAQTAPDLHYETLRTPHLEVTYAAGLEDVARRAAGSAERAWAGLARELHPPRGPVSIVVTDNYDTSNGYATTFPTNRIVIFARPTVDANTLKFIDDWVDLVVTHELTHLFHLDRSRGLWQLGQWVFGRNPFLFPNAYSPSWLSEGIAVHYESKLTGAGRDVGTDFDAMARAHALAGTTPAAHELSAASPRYPLGNVPYVFGSPLVEEAAASGSMGRFVDVSAGRLIPFMLNANAKAAFGISFDGAYARWTDSVARAARALARDVPPRAPLVRGGWFAQRPRWDGDSALVWTAADPKSLPSLRRVSAAGGPVRVIAARTTTDATSLLPGGWRVFAQQDFTDPYSQRTDLYLEHDGDVARLTTDQRLTQPDARFCADPLAGSSATRPASALRPATPICIVAVQLTPGQARLALVRVTATDVEVTPITEPSAASLWSEPRWSRAGDRIVATHWMRGGESEIGVLDRTGRVLATFGRARAVNGSPAWGPEDLTVFFTSDRSGRSAIYRANVASGALAFVADSPTALYESEPSPDGTRVATFQLGAEGYDLTVLDALVVGTPADSSSALGPARGMTVATTDAPAAPYAAWRSALPRYWTPQLDQGFDGSYRVGLFTSGFDLVDRHSWQLTATQDTKRNEPAFDFGYSFAGLGEPVVNVGASAVWDHPGVPDSAGLALFPVARRRTFADASLTFLRRRISYAASVSVGGTYEWRGFTALAGVPFARFAPADRAALGRTYTYPSYWVSAGVSNARQPAFALGPEDGFSASATVQQRWRTDAPDRTRATSVIGVLAGYRALDFGARAHHLVALRVAGATEDAVSASEFDAGGNSGTIVQVVPGLTFGDGRRTFFVRGFEPGVMSGSRALGANAEYRFPIAFPGSGLGALPFFLQRVSGVLFADGASAWCPTGSPGSPICPRATAGDWISSVGAELHFDAAVEYDQPYRLRIGFAAPASAPARVARPSPSAYVTLGLPF
ncbi:MAG TPA: hypothetical protein VG916_15900 [Gemmatimonadaceae bacterium]|nr:hypothetical protein [Gemmatimonadaceae bacterium]